MNSIIKKCTTSLKPVYIVGLKRLLSTTTSQSDMQSSDSSDKTKSVHSLVEPIGNPVDLSPRVTVEDSQQQEQANYEEDVKVLILDASLQFVPVHGWSKEAISAGAQTLGYPGVIHGMFPRGGFDLVQHFYLASNKRLVDMLLAAKETSVPDNSSEDRSSRAKIEKAVRCRLEMILPYMKQWPQALAVMSLPPNVPTSLANLLCLVDDIFYYTGDRSVDLSWYSRRVVLAGIYKATELYMLQDQSVEYANSWEFLRRRMDEAAQVRSYMKASEQAGQVAKDFATSAFITARSILGLSWNR